MKRAHKLRTAGLVSILASGDLVLGACSDAGENGAQDSQNNASGEGFEFSNCGFTMQLDKPAERIMSVEQGTTDNVLAFGLDNTLAGYSHQKDAPLEGYEDEMEKSTEVSPEVASAEQIRTVDPDAMLSPFESVYTDDGAGTREEWKKLGVATWYSNVECRDKDGNEGKNAYDLLLKDYQQLGQLFGAEDKAAELEKKHKEHVDAATESVKDAPKDLSGALLYTISDGGPYVGGKHYHAQGNFDLNGVKTVFDDANEAWPELSWEALADKDPDFIVLADLPGRGAPGDKAEEKIEMLEKDPATRNLKAVKEKRYVIVKGIGLSGSVQSYEPLEDVAEYVKNWKN